MVTHSTPTSEVGSSNPKPYVEKSEVAYQSDTIHNLDRLCALVTSAHRINHCNIMYTVLKAT